MMCFMRENPVTTAVSVALVALEFSPYGLTGALLRLPGNLRRRREEEAAKWVEVRLEVPAIPLLSSILRKIFFKVTDREIQWLSDKILDEV